MADESIERDDDVEAHAFEEQADLNQLESQADLNRDEGPDVEGHRQMEGQIENYQLEE